MRILVVSQHYWPEPFNIADMCEMLVSHGHDVTVLTGLPNYPDGKIYPGYERKKRLRESRNGVDIVRVPLAPRKRNVINRARNYYSFKNNATRESASLDPSFEVVLAFQTSPVMMAEPAIAYAERTGTPLLHYVVDIWPECLLSGGIKKGSAIYQYFARVSRRIYDAADRLAVTSPLFIDYLSDLLDKAVDAVHLPQYAEDVFSDNAGQAPEGYEKNAIHFTFAGNVGAAQSVDTIIRAAALLKEDRRFAFHIVGSGSELERCQDLSSDLRCGNVVFHGRKPLGDMPAYYAASDAMLATFSNDPVLAYTLPRKVQSYLASGRPIVGALAGEARRVVEEAQCGLCCDPEDAKGLANTCRLFAARADCEDYGRSGRAYYEKHFSKEFFFKTLEKELEDMKGTKHGV